MAVYYVYSGAAGSNNGSNWANAFTTLTTAFVTEVAGDTLYVAHDHVESSGTALTFTSSGSTTSPTKVICVSRAGSVPPVSADRRATAQIATTGNAAINFTGGTTVYDGIIFVAGNSTGVANIFLQNTGVCNTLFTNCSLRIGSTGNGKINMTAAGSYAELINTTASFSGTGQGFSISGGMLRWLNTVSALIGTAVPTSLFTTSTGNGEIECVGVDLSAAGSGKTLFLGVVAGIRYRALDCKLDASVTKSTVPQSYNTSESTFIRSGASGVNYTISRHLISGLLVEETTIVRTGGASDGTTPIAWRVDTNATCNFLLPYECPPIAIWNDTAGPAVTATVEGIWGGGAVPNDDDVWLDVEYLGSASSPQGSFVNDGKADLLATAAGQTSSSETWGGSTTKFKLGVTFTPQMKGWIYARVKCGKPSSTFYVDPLVVLS